jgi:hypothetical protein
LCVNTSGRDSKTSASLAWLYGTTVRAIKGFQCNSAEFAGARRTMRNTGWSAARSVAAKAEPIRPDEPAIATTGLATVSQP